MFVSSTVTSAPRPTATCVALVPATPPPRTVTTAGCVPGTPGTRRPGPPFGLSIVLAPTIGASRPATSLIGASRGSARFGSCTVSYAIAVTPEATSARVRFSSAARCR